MNRTVELPTDPFRPLDSPETPESPHEPRPLRVRSFGLTIIIDGIDTGINDFQYQGKLVSQHLADCAAAKNHGDYVSRVAKLTNALKKAGLLTGNQKGIIMDAAAKSSYGKK